MMLRIWKIGLYFCLFVLFAFLFFLWLIVNPPKRERYLIPDDYFGWLCVTYSVPGAPALGSKDGFRILKFSSSGIIETSTEIMSGKYKDEYWFYNNKALRKMNIEKEMGGGYTVATLEAPDRVTFMLWVSPDAKKQQLIYSSGNSNKCGPVK